MKCTSDMVELRGKLGSRIKQLREEQKLSQTQFSLMVGVDRSHISRIENGSCNLTFDVLLIIANGLDVSPSDLLEGIGLPTTAGNPEPALFLEPPRHSRHYGLGKL